MTSRLDQIFSFVNEIELRTNRLTSVVNDSNDLINFITTLNASTIEFDDTIDDIRLLMNKNNESITEKIYMKRLFIWNRIYCIMTKLLINNHLSIHSRIYAYVG